jgi:hypothetical protein
VGGDSRERAIELAHRMEESRHFAQTYIETEHTAQSGSGDTVQFDINGVYLPDSTPAAEPKKTGTSKRSKP